MDLDAQSFAEAHDLSRQKADLAESAARSS